MLFKIILFFSHGCFAKTKRNLKWKGGWVGERGGCAWCKCSWLCANRPFAADKRQPARDTRTRLWYTDHHLTIILNLSKKIRRMSRFRPILKACHHSHHQPSAASQSRDDDMWQSQWPWAARQLTEWRMRNTERSPIWTLLLQSFFPSTFQSLSFMPNNKMGDWLIFGFSTSHSQWWAQRHPRKVSFIQH